MGTLYGMHPPVTVNWTLFLTAVRQLQLNHLLLLEKNRYF